MRNNPPPYRQPYLQPPQNQQNFSPFDYNQDGKVNFQDLKSVVKTTFDVNNDGAINLDDLTSAVLRSGNKSCSRCNKVLKKKSKYATGVCVECYRNPTDEERCNGEIADGSRCKRRMSDESSRGYCGIHMNKYKENTQ